MKKKELLIQKQRHHYRDPGSVRKQRSKKPQNNTAVLQKQIPIKEIHEMPEKKNSK